MVNIRGNLSLLSILGKVASVTKERLERDYSRHGSFSDILLYTKPDNFWIARVNEQDGALITKYYLVGEHGPEALKRGDSGHGTCFWLNDPKKLSTLDSDFWTLIHLLQLPLYS